MTSRSFKLIFTLLTLSVLCVLALQAFWIRNYYIQKQDEFNSNVYSALEKIATKINERQNIHNLQKKVSIHKENIQINGKPSGVIVNKSVTVSNYSQVRNSKKEDVEIKISDVNSIKKEMPEVKFADSSVKISLGNPTLITKTLTTQVGSDKEGDINKLMDKMLMEIKIVDSDEKNVDTLNNIIKKVFVNKGLFLPYEFALKKIFKNKDENLAQSPGFNNKETSFVTDLSANKVFSTHNYLFVQFNNISSFVFSSMRNMIILSLLFSLIIIGVFYYTLRLIIKQKKLSEIKNDFINNMTHELKTPIATISLATDAINSPEIKNDAERFKDYTRILKEENQKLNSHVERVLEMAMIDKGELQINKKPVDLVLLLKKSIDTYKLHIQKQNANVSLKSEREVFALIDENHMQAVFNNLLDNALKYSKDQCSVLISISSSLSELIINFKDNGIGIDEGMKEKVFEKFFRAQRGNLHDVKGFGLGLAYVRSIIETHGGTIDLITEKGTGSEFIIKLKRDA